jgi:predicted nucleic acid-binding protein
MSDKDFLDTNIIVYSFDNSKPGKQSIAGRMIKEGILEGNTFISYQVVQEFINVATRKFKVPLTFSDARLYVDKILMSLWEIYPSKELIHSALDISERCNTHFMIRL